MSPEAQHALIFIVSLCLNGAFIFGFFCFLLWYSTIKHILDDYYKKQDKLFDQATNTLQKIMKISYTSNSAQESKLEKTDYFTHEQEGPAHSIADDYEY